MTYAITGILKDENCHFWIIYITLGVHTFWVRILWEANETLGDNERKP